jgi:hypothetical protein
MALHKSKMAARTAGIRSIKSYMTKRRAEWKRLGFHAAATLFGTGLGVLMIYPVMAASSLLMQQPTTRAILIFLMPTGDHWWVAIGLVIAWVLGMLVTYAVLTWALKA